MEHPDVYAQLNVDLSAKKYGSDYASVVEAVNEILVRQWCSDYNAVAPGAQIVEFRADTFTFLYDLTEGNDEPFVPRVTREARVVAAFGMTTNNQERRKKSRMQGFIGGFRGIPYYKGYDKGHFIAHSIGGMLDQNLFPQKTEVNQGRSEEGRRYRDIERFCEDNEGIFMFSHPVYNDPSWIPAQIEIGFLSKDFHLKVERVGN